MGRLSPLTWTARQLMMFWIAAISLAAACLMVGQSARDEWQFAVALPYDGTGRSILASAILLLRHAFAERPWESIALIGIPCGALLISLLWFVARLRARRTR